MPRYRAPGVDPLAWVFSTDDLDSDALARDGVAYLACETLDGRPLGWAPLGSPAPFAHGEGVRWRIRVVGA